MKKKLLLLALLSGVALSGCDALDSFFDDKSETTPNQVEQNGNQTNTPNSGGNNQNSCASTGGNASTDTGSNIGNNTGTNTGDNTGTNTGENTGTDTGTKDDPIEENGKISSVSFPKRELDIGISTGKYDYESVTVNFSSKEELTLDDKDGVFASSDPTVAEIDNYGRLFGRSVGHCVVTFKSTVCDVSCSMLVYVHTSVSSIQREYVKVSDVDDIKVGDELVFASEDFGVAASISKKDYYIDVTNDLSFGTNKLNSIASNVAEFLVCPGKNDDPNCFTLQIQDGSYLAAKETDRHRSLYYFKTQKAQVDWIIERPSGYNEDFVVNYDLRDDYWLMFNRINASDIRFNIYDSNEQSLMKKPTIYRKTIIH